MKTIKVKSLPFQEVIKEIAESLKTHFEEKCSEYFLDIPQDFGEGKIRGINFSNGLGIIIYDCTFNEKTEIKFTKNDIHPVKYLYISEGTIQHRFAETTNQNQLDKYGCAIVASKNHNGHILSFDAQEKTYLLSLEIDRKKFFEKMECELTELSDELKNLFLDTNASSAFYHQGYYSVSFEQLINSLNEHEDEKFIRKLFLEGKALEIFIKQIDLFEDDLKPDSDKTFLRPSELSKIKELAVYIEDNIHTELRIMDLSTISGLNANKLQNGFKYIFQQTVNEYLMQQRMLKASFLLKTTDKSLSEISEEIGITSKSYFSKSFKKFYGVLPRDYRNN
jgi:AraC-like DNA-binding protein